MEYFVQCSLCVTMHGPYNYTQQAEKVVRVCGECGDDVCPDCREQHNEVCSRKAEDWRNSDKPQGKN